MVLRFAYFKRESAADNNNINNSNDNSNYNNNNKIIIIIITTTNNYKIKRKINIKRQIIIRLNDWRVRVPYFY